jgi:carboxyl-terminal processing protease
MQNPFQTRLILTMVVLSLAALACQTVMEGFTPPTEIPTLPPTETLTPAPTDTVTPSPVPPTSTPQPEPSPTLEPVSQDVQVEILDELWGIVNEEYLYEDFNGVDWNEVYTRYRQIVNDGLTTEDFYAAMDMMVYELNDEHSVFLNPQQVVAEEAEYAGENDYVGIGVWIQFLPNEDRAVVLLTFPGSPAEAAGIRSHDSILAVEGVSLEHVEGSALDLLLGVEGTEVTFTVQTPGEEPRTMTVPRQKITSPLPVPYQALTSPGGKRIGYIVIPSFSDSTIDKQVGEALAAMTQEEALDGLILDNRLNGGGWDNVASSTLGYFTRGVVGHFTNRVDRYAFRVPRKDVGGSDELPLVVLVGPDTASFGEIFAGVLKDQGRATIIGETTPGNVELLWGYNFKDGSRAWIAHDRFIPVNDQEADWEHTGIVVDIEAPALWFEVTLETDPAVLAALEVFDGE